jgi:hypothetical protein
MGNAAFESWVDEKPLDRDLCQRIHYQALVRAARGCHTEEVPSTVDLTRLRELGQLLGSEVYLSHPQMLERLFTGVSLGIYRMIVELYCSRLERSIAMVWRIVRARAAGRIDIPYEAVWALCMHLEEHRRHETEVTIERDNSAWWLFSLRCEEEEQTGKGWNGQRLIVCLLDLASEDVIAFRVVDARHVGAAYGLVVYDALLEWRHPGRHSAAGLIWRVPERLIVEGELPRGPQEGCSRLGMVLETRRDPPPLWHRLQTDFRREIVGRGLGADQLADAFDTYLHKVYGYSPLRSREERDREYHHLVGYNRDPAWQCPALRHFLPLYSGTIARDGTIPFDGLNYADDLLAYWVGATVTFRRSEQAEALIWVYLDGHMLCAALARELRRRDGSYRAQRSGR